MDLVKLKTLATKKLRKGMPLLQKEDLLKDADFPQAWVTFSDERGNFVGQGYLGQQNKGIGWLVSLQEEQLNQAFFEGLFNKAKARRQAFFNNQETTAFRLFNGEGDGLGGLTIDWYDNYAVFSWYNEVILQKKAEIVAAFQAVYPEVLGASEKIRYKSQLPESQWLYGTQPNEPLIVKENAVNYAVYLNEGLMTGIFLDQKEVRNQLVEGLAVGQEVLNLFSYTGAFSVAAAMGGAASTTSVDLAKRSRQKTEEQFAVNQLSLENQKIIVMDVFEYYKYAKRKNLSYDLIILDPPSFARNKKKTFSVAKNYGELVTDALSILKENGRIIASTNAANLSLERFQGLVEAAFEAAGVNYQKEQVFRLPVDFQTLASFSEGNYLKVLFYKIKK
ncbi:23S rRNA (cytosine1962-C5)-methyltransferase [Enterococcus sp. PF1-24]|uniref:class I SAM-dependent rRNA methyltransferase n=1 Tax=unclassified Enterococcus TaxID=2608891 RepID=UPI002473C762|nr:MULTISPECIES: class I SAM-dependent rRNA methyltransferase [unclassified Enterococcus]MDH6365235.1 23S rRNA (cytosine1962-C5)-methyltransferase [Enterococcus sp. PFB1-1]MDH6402336.1 23S rRNA (cytosine1962-C5)-methyltransferase [Enterococcus sp. PF1-24]